MGMGPKLPLCSRTGPALHVFNPCIPDRVSDGADEASRSENRIEIRPRNCYFGGDLPGDSAGDQLSAPRDFRMAESLVRSVKKRNFNPTVSLVDVGAGIGVLLQGRKVELASANMFDYVNDALQSYGKLRSRVLGGVPPDNYR